MCDPTYPTPLNLTLCKISLPLSWVPHFSYFTLKHNCKHTPLYLSLSHSLTGAHPPISTIFSQQDHWKTL